MGPSWRPTECEKAFHGLEIVGLGNAIATVDRVSTATHLIVEQDSEVRSLAVGWSRTGGSLYMPRRGRQNLTPLHDIEYDS